MTKPRSKLTQFGFYSLAIAISIPIVLFELYTLRSIPVTDLFFSDAFLCLISIPNFFSNQLATAAYLGRTADMALGTSQNKADNELTGTLIGIASALFIGLVLLGLGVQAPFVNTIGLLANAFFLLRYLNVFAGFGNRIGRYFDWTDQSRPLFEKIFVLGFIALGFTLGAGLFLASVTSTAQVLINGSSLISFFTGVQGLPTAIAGLIFATSIGSLFGSFADYTVKSVGQLLSRYYYGNQAPPQNDHSFLKDIHQFKKNRPYEYLGATVGLGLGLLITPYIIMNLMAANIIAHTGVAAIVTSGIVAVFTCSIYSSTCSRLGRVLDAILNTFSPTTQTPQPSPSKKVQLEPTHEIKPKKRKDRSLLLTTGMWSTREQRPRETNPFKYTPQMRPGR